MDANFQDQCTAFVEHLDDVVAAFNQQSDARGLGVHLDATDLVTRTRLGRTHRRNSGLLFTRTPRRALSRADRHRGRRDC